MDYSNYHIKNFYSLDKEKREAAVQFLADNENWDGFTELYNEDPESWWTIDVWHFRGGMAVRNFLRINGFGEEELGVENLDDYYVALVEKAAERKGLITLDW